MMPAESAHDTVAALGEVGLLQFKDLNSDKSAFQRTFANQVRSSDQVVADISCMSMKATNACSIAGCRARDQVRHQHSNFLS